MRSVVLVTAVLISAQALATKQPENPHAIAGSISGSVSGSRSSADADSMSHSSAAALAVGRATASQSQSASADNAGNSQNITTTYERSAPSLGQGSLIPSGCGAGVNGGGSQSGGAAFLGLAWTTHECYLLQYAAAYQAIGMPDFSCDLLATSKTVKKALKKLGREHPDCTIAHVDPQVPTLVVLDGAESQLSEVPPTHAEVNEKIDRAFRKSMEKFLNEPVGTLQAE